MTSQAASTRTVRRWWDACPSALQLALFALAVFVLGSASLMWFRPDGSTLAVWWPVAGLGTAAVVLADDRAARRQFLVVHAVATAAVNLTGPLEPTVAVLLGVVNGIEVAVVAAVLGARVDDRRRLHDLRDLARFVLAATAGAAVFAITVAAIVSVTTADAFAMVLRSLLPSHGSAILFVLLLVARGHVRQAAAGRPELALQVASTALMTAIVFAPTQRLGLTFLLLLPLLWTAARATVRWLGLQIIVLVSVASVLTLAGGGPFAPGPGELIADVATTVVVLQVMVVSLTSAALLVHLAFADRTATLEQLRRRDLELAAERDAAVAAERAKSEFLATMSHEIRTPLNAVIGLGGMLEETPLDDRQRRHVAGIRVAGTSLLALVNDILDLSKLEAGRVELEPVVFSPARLVDDVAELFREALHQRGLALEVEVDPQLPAALVGDVSRLRQILLNLVGNAVKFTQRGTVRIVARSAAAAPDRPTLGLDVIDTGPGMPESEQRRLYETFAQGEAGRTHGGTGLGLAICHKLARQLGGSIDHDSVVGRGTRFTVEVPLELAAPADLAPTIEQRGVIGLALTGAAATELTDLLDGWGLPHRPVTPTELAGRPPRGLAAVVADVPPDAHASTPTLHDAAGRCTTRWIVLGDPPPSERPCTTVVPRPLDPSHLFDALADSLLRTDDRLRGHEVATQTPRRVLLVEDNPANQIVSRHLLDKLGHQVDTVSDGNEALAARRRRRFDVVLMDCQMPVLDGFEATRRWREQEGDGPDRTPIVALTASTSPAVRERAAAVGMDGFLSKPVELGALADAIARHARSSDAPAGDTSPAPTVDLTPGPAGAATATAGALAPRQNGDVAPAAAGAATATPEAAIDPQRWAALAEFDTYDPGTVAALVEMFAVDAPIKLAALDAAVADGDLAEVERLAHALRGSAGNLGAVEVADALAAVEVGAADGRAPVTGTVTAITEAVDRALTEARQLLG